MTTGFTLSLARILLSGANAMSLAEEGGWAGKEGGSESVRGGVGVGGAGGGGGYSSSEHTMMMSQLQAAICAAGAARPSLAQLGQGSASPPGLQDPSRSTGDFPSICVCVCV